MNTKSIGKYELIDGTAIIDNNFVIITANEAFYKFMGVSTSYTIMDIIHQVDFDDFVDVSNGLRPNAEKIIVVRMKRYDNSYRWMLTNVKRCVSENDGNISNEYLEIHVSDIIALEKQRISFREMLINCNQILALEGEIYFVYNRHNRVISFGSYVDNHLMDMCELPASSWIKALAAANGSIDGNPENLALLKNDFLNCKTEFSHQLSTSYFSISDCIENFQIKGAAVSENMKPAKIVGSIRNIDSKDFSYSTNTYEYAKHSELLSCDEVNDYINKNILINSKCEITLVLMEIDNLDKIRERDGSQAADELHTSIINTAKKMVGYRGVVGLYGDGVIYIAIKNIASDQNTRAFVESLRNQISWNYKLLTETDTITFSIGVSRRPYNGIDCKILFKKAVKALEIARQDGHNCFVLYIDNIHGELK